YSLFLGQSSGWVARGSAQALSQMNGCRVPGNRGLTEPGLQANWQNSPFLHFRAKRLKTQAERGAWAPVKPAVLPAEKASENSSF
ncbi:MAG: hypothetical protein KJ755_14410, partial [Alphaproteobacteria bacterium]|nr:hypothetical protein [Alphaproteobacteria bacterium]